MYNLVWGVALPGESVVLDLTGLIDTEREGLCGDGLSVC